MDVVTIDGLDENEFRRSIENMLRHGQADEAATKLRGLLEPYAGEGKILPARFLSVSAAEVALAGWERLGERISQYDRPNTRISAVSVAVTDPEDGGAQPDAAGRLTPYIETSYFSDDAYPFSDAARSDLLDGYSIYGCQWQGDSEAADSTLSVEGVDDLYGAIARLEAKLLGSQEPSMQEIRAGSLGSCYLAVLIHQAVRDQIHRNGLPRSMCVLAGSNGVYPFFDAPVMSSEECLDNGLVKPVTAAAPAMAPELEEPQGEEVQQDSSDYDSLLNLMSRKARKKPVIVLDQGEADTAARLHDLAASEHMAGAGKGPLIGVLAGLDPSPAIADTEAVPDAGSAVPDVEPVAGEFGGRQMPADAPAEDGEPIGGWRGDQVADPLAVVESPEALDRPGADWRERDGEPALPVPDLAEPDEPAAPSAIEWPAPSEQAPGRDDAAVIDDLAAFPAQPDESATAAVKPPPPPKSELGHHGHVLRARMVRAPERGNSFADRLAAALRWFQGWLKRS